MKREGMVGSAVIWGIGAVMLAVSVVLFTMSVRERNAGLTGLGYIEILIGLVLVIFAFFSFYMAHK